MDPFEVEFSALMQKIGVSDDTDIAMLWGMVQNNITEQDANENNAELNVHQKLELAERSNATYREQIGWIEYRQDPNRVGIGNITTDEIEMEELRQKAQALAERTILENFELREMINTLREENFTIRHECYEKQDKIDSQFSKMDKLQNVHKTRMDHVTKLLNAYGLEERFPIDRRDMYIREFEGDSMLVYAYIRNELETQYDVHILSDVKDLITRFAARTYDIVDEESATEECFEEEESQKSTAGDASLDELSDEEEHDVICID
eukprot:915820_1